MVKTNTNPEVRFAGFTEDWEESMILNIAPLQRGFDLPKAKMKAGDFPVVMSNGISEYHDEYKVLGPGVVTGRSGTIGNVHYVENNFWPHNTTLWVTDFKGNYPLFIYIIFNNLNLSKFGTGSGVPTLNRNDVHQQKVCVPKYNEQVVISNFFENIDNLLTEHQQKHSKLKALKHAMLDKMYPKQGQLVPEIRFKGFEGDWGDPTLGNIGVPFTGLSGKTKNDFGHGEGRYITYMNVFSNPISDIIGIDKIEIDTSQNEVTTGDVLFTVSSETAAEVGMSSVWTGNQENVYLNSFCFGYRPKIKMDYSFLANLLRTKAFRDQMILLAQGISRYNISKNKVMNLKISLPKFDEQVVIGEYFINLDSLITQHSYQIIKLTNLKKAFLAKMFI